ncbi:hypothetical protein K435DRAFT_837493 [Dendrothele bispora CBS 962.96]|uniref:NmrA-like domain-containing protein n=1 Tax=Dendrothele bispora (strain CBS 962.96) TaxID=1314807 RepID=A0A4S8MBW1_DENBC|nr:hypothetical protein K435DRAFT_837493 [Dendrothele bispora CBS 962.96]
MSPTTYTHTSFAVLGLNGNITPFIIDALSKHPGVKKLIVLSRPSSSTPPSLPANAEVIQVDYNDHAALVEIFKKNSTEVVISTLSNAAIWDAQKKSALAAKEAGVKLFVPSEYGIVTIGFAGKGAGNPFVDKDEFAEFLKSIELPYARFFTGMWLRYVPWAIGYDANQKVNILGKGETPISFTAEEDTAGFIAHVTTTLPLTRLSNAHFRLEGERLTTRQIADRLSKPFEYVQAIPGSNSELRTAIVGQCETGAGSTGWDRLKQEENRSDSEEGAGSANKLWEGHVWLKLEDVVQL